MIRLTQRRRPAAAIILVIGTAASAVPLFDIWQDIFVPPYKAPATTLVENLPLLVLALVVVGGGVLVVTSDIDGEYAGTIATWCAGAAALSLALFALIVQVQLMLQNDLKPYIIAADAVVIGTVGGLGVGWYAADTERRREELAAERDQFAALFENVPSPVAGVDLSDGEAVVVAANPAFEEAFGRSEEQLVGKNLHDHVVPPGNGGGEQAEAVPADGGGGARIPEELGPSPGAFSGDGQWHQRELRLETPHGRRDFLQLTVPDDDRDSRADYAIYIDVTDRKQRYERLQVLSRTLRHDIRNHMTIIGGNAELLTEQLDQRGDHRLHELADQIERNAEELIAITERTRTIEEQVAGDRETEELDLVPVVERAIADLDDQFPERGVRIETDLPDRAMIQSSDAIGTAVGNVLENAVQHNDADEPTVAVRIEQGEDYHVLVVDDNGPGIRTSEYELVTGQRDRTQLEHTSGLGLWLTNWIVTDAGGYLSFETNDGQGTVVRIGIPSA